ncbi:Hypothetical_protein [Hexamita inflata]|uniref:Hypothetical_protein n=1 Tax=Hexamita inflata TaxID=28002 RepID=A0AA86V159_9EUKA|nr:Hypothetical protein HINF_LOCUS60001 [Hexamita inflata]
MFKVPQKSCDLSQLMSLSPQIIIESGNMKAVRDITDDLAYGNFSDLQTISKLPQLYRVLILTQLALQLQAFDQHSLLLQLHESEQISVELQLDCERTRADLQNSLEELNYLRNQQIQLDLQNVRTINLLENDFNQIQAQNQELKNDLMQTKSKLQLFDQIVLVDHEQQTEPEREPAVLGAEVTGAEVTEKETVDKQCETVTFVKVKKHRHISAHDQM